MAAAHPSLIIDTSAVVAILTQEANAEVLVEKLLAAQIRILATPCAAEAVMVLRHKLGRDPEAVLSEFYREFAIQLIAFESQHLPWFNYGFSRYGKGNHPAGLNFGDCFTYAVAKSTGLPVLFVGNDFSRTDLTQA